MRAPAIVTTLAAAASLAASTPAASMTPGEKLDCIAFLAAALGTSEEAQAKVGLASALGWYIGRYEAETGKELGDELIERATTLDQADIAAIQGRCVPPMQDYGERLTTLGKKITDASRK